MKTAIVTIVEDNRIKVYRVEFDGEIRCIKSGDGDRVVTLREVRFFSQFVE